MGKNNRVLKTIIGVGLLLIGLIGAVVIFKTKSRPVRQKMSAMIPVVETTELSTISTSVTVRCMGTVIEIGRAHV